MTTLPDLAWLDGLALADLVRKKEVSPLELVEATIARIEALNPTLNAVITPMYDEARATAKQPLGDGAFAGVPFLLKDLVAEYAGVPMAEGSNFLKGRYTPDQDSELVVRQKAAGLIIVAKTNTPEFGLLPTTEPTAFGATHNPWDTPRTPAGSSGGAAAAVAAGIAPMAHANDGGGSIRMPASCCGLFGLKPTRARNTLGPAYGEAGCGLAAEHAVTRSVRDSAALLDATSGPMTGDPYYPTPPGRPYLEEVGADPGRLTIALNTIPLTGAEVHPDCRRAAEKTASLCADLGHEIVEATPDVDGMQMVKRFGDAWTGFLGWAIADWERRLDLTAKEEDFEPATWATYLHAKKTDHGGVFDGGPGSAFAESRRRSILRQIRRHDNADANSAAGSAGLLRVFARRSPGLRSAAVPVHRLHADVQCHGPAGDVAAAALDPHFPDELVNRCPEMEIML